MHELIISYGHAAVVAILSGLGLVLTRYVFALIKRTWLRDALGRLWNEVKESVLAVEQVYVAALKEAHTDGKLTEAEKAEAKKRAIAEIKSNYGAKGLQKLARVLGIDSIDDWLGSKVEAAVGEEKRLGKLVEAGR